MTAYTPDKIMTVRDVEVGEVNEYFDPADGVNGFDDAIFFLTAEACNVSTDTLGSLDGEDVETLKAEFMESQMPALLDGATLRHWDGVERSPEGGATFTPTNGAQVRLRKPLGRDNQRMGDAQSRTSRVIRLLSRVSGLDERAIRDWAAQDLYRFQAALPDFMPAARSQKRTG